MSQAAPADADALAALHRAEAEFRWVRWLAAGFLVVQSWLYAPPPGVALPFPRWPVALGMLAAVLALQAVSLSSRRLTDVRALRRRGNAVFAGDTAVVLAISRCSPSTAPAPCGRCCSSRSSRGPCAAGAAAR